MTRKDAGRDIGENGVPRDAAQVVVLATAVAAVRLTKNAPMGNSDRYLFCGRLQRDEIDVSEGPVAERGERPAHNAETGPQQVGEAG